MEWGWGVDSSWIKGPVGSYDHARAAGCIKCDKARQGWLTDLPFQLGSGVPWCPILMSSYDFVQPMHSLNCREFTSLSGIGNHENMEMSEMSYFIHVGLKISRGYLRLGYLYTL